MCDAIAHATTQFSQSGIFTAFSYTHVNGNQAGVPNCSMEREVTDRSKVGSRKVKTGYVPGTTIPIYDVVVDPRVSNRTDTGFKVQCNYRLPLAPEDLDRRQSPTLTAKGICS
jgi:hypothetical protein